MWSLYQLSRYGNHWVKMVINACTFCGWLPLLWYSCLSCARENVTRENVTNCHRLVSLATRPHWYLVPGAWYHWCSTQVKMIMFYVCSMYNSLTTVEVGCVRYVLEVYVLCMYYSMLACCACSPYTPNSYSCRTDPRFQDSVLRIIQDLVLSR